MTSPYETRHSEHCNGLLRKNARTVVCRARVFERGKVLWLQTGMGSRTTRLLFSLRRRASLDYGRGMTTTNREILLFVCDSLQSGEEHHDKLASARSLGKAKTVARYDLVDLGAQGALVEGGLVAVSGELYGLPPAALAAIDVFRGHPVLSCRSPVRLEDGREAEAYFIAAAQSAGRRRILSGEWQKRRGATGLGGGRSSGPTVRWAGRRS